MKTLTEGDKLKDQFGNVYEILEIDLKDPICPVSVELIDVSEEYMRQARFWDFVTSEIKSEPNEIGDRDWIYASFDEFDYDDWPEVDTVRALAITLESMEPAGDKFARIPTSSGKSSQFNRNENLQQASAQLAKVLEVFKSHGYRVKVEIESM